MHAEPGDGETRLLLVEDDADLSAMLVELLTAEGHAVTAARSLQTALHAALTRSFEVLVVDRRLPDGDGLDLVGRLRVRGLTSPVLVLTAQGTPADRVAGLDGGADDYLVKPFHVDELLARIRALRRRHLDDAAHVPFGDGSLDVDARTAVLPDGSTVELTPAETAVLAELGRRPTRVFSREELRDTVSPGSSSSSLIDTYVYGLRRKLGTQAVRTVRGIGYRAGRFR